MEAAERSSGNRDAELHNAALKVARRLLESGELDRWKIKYYANYPPGSLITLSRPTATVMLAYYLVNGEDRWTLRAYDNLANLLALTRNDQESRVRNAYNDARLAASVREMQASDAAKTDLGLV